MKSSYQYWCNVNGKQLCEDDILFEKRSLVCLCHGKAIRGRNE